MPPRQFTVCVDFDGVIAEYDGFKGADVFGAPIEGAKEALQKMKKEGWLVIIFTTRLPDKKFKEYLSIWGIPYDYINKNPEQYPNTNKGKPAANVYIDDRAITFEGNWLDTFEAVKIFEPWYNKKEK